MVLIYCRTGNRAGVALQQLESWGYTNVHNIGGYETLMSTCGDCDVVEEGNYNFMIFSFLFSSFSVFCLYFSSQIFHIEFNF